MKIIKNNIGIITVISLTIGSGLIYAFKNEPYFVWLYVLAPPFGVSSIITPAFCIIDGANSDPYPPDIHLFIYVICLLTNMVYWINYLS